MKRMTRFSVLCGLLMTVARSASAEGELMVIPASTKVFNAHTQTVTVKNAGDAPLYLNINVQKVMNPGVMPEKKVALGEVAHPGMLASPDKLTLGPNQTRSIVLKSLAEPEQEELYRLYVLPVRSLKVEQATEDKITAPMSVAIGYGVLVRHMPAPGKQKTGWTHRCEAGGVTLENTGNVRQLFTDVVDGKSKTPQRVALFPGTPQHFAVKRMAMNIDDKPVTVECP
ncbi:pilus assembly protein [Burkholderia cenocepacia]|uniref:pilus assembly protein n=1 Tax=Burkholderia cenocepacia TaxID=95486 RepID=UPI002AB6BECA|nr:pilus assembly protein [Burkholderia cenocepacia]